MVSAWQLAGPYTAAGIGLAWNAWLTWHQRRSYGLTVTWRDPTEQEAEQGRKHHGEHATIAVVEIRNAGDSTMYDVQPVSAAAGALHWTTAVPTAAAGEAAVVVPVERARIYNRTDGPSVRVSYLTRPNSKHRRVAFGRVPPQPGDVVWLTPQTRRRSYRERLARRVAPAGAAGS